jgi:hypothetical protein
MIEHIVIALAMQAGIAVPLRNLSAGTAAACAWAICREITQAEYRWIEQLGEGRRANMPWWGGLDPQVWHFDAWLDWLAPTAACIGAALLLRKRFASN